MPDSVYIRFISAADVEELSLTDEEIIGAVEEGLRAQGSGRAVIEPRVHLEPDPAIDGHFNILRGSISSMGVAGVKIVGDFVDNYLVGLPSEMALLNLFDPSTGMPKAVVEATSITEMRTGALTAIGARYLARSDSKILAHVGARGTAYWNIRLLDRLFDFEQIRVHSRRPESREEFGRRMSDELGKPVIVAPDWESCVSGADIVVEASRLRRPEPLLKTSFVAPGSLIIPYGTMSAVELSLTDIMDKIVVDDWAQCATGRFGALRAHVENGKLSKDTIHGELCNIVVGTLPGRQSPLETILFWHRGLSLSDIALGSLLLERAERQSLGERFHLR
ncbi:MAG: ornithine cyclodeaminase family protein [Actinomycetota bacterium]|nr:ornithine cyclodeaminase family protein [Actinomycetota bacterium]